MASAVGRALARPAFRAVAQQYLRREDLLNWVGVGGAGKLAQQDLNRTLAHLIDVLIHGCQVEKTGRGQPDTVESGQRRFGGDVDPAVVESFPDAECD